MPVMRLGYIQVRVTDMEEAVNHYSNTLGMKVVAAGEGGAHMSPHGISPGKMTYLKAWDEWDHHSVVLEEGGVGLVKFGYKVSSADDLAVFEKRVQQFGATIQRMSKGENLAVGDGFDVAIIKGPNGKLHHFAFLLEDWNAILRAGDIFGMDQVSVDIGPTRHGITRGTTIYFFDPSGNRNEVFAGGYLTGPDFPTITWTADQLGKGIFYISGEVNERFTTVVT
jgi:catechol 2,3-dioxygenase-like lactoylglutathione lyase family enzyme